MFLYMTVQHWSHAFLPPLDWTKDEQVGAGPPDQLTNFLSSGKTFNVFASQLGIFLALFTQDEPKQQVDGKLGIPLVTV